MSQLNAGDKKTGGKRLGDQILRSLGKRSRSSSAIVSSTTTRASSATTPVSETAQPPGLSGNNSTLQIRELIPAMKAPEPLGRPDLEMVVQAPHLVARSPAPPLSSTAAQVPHAGGGSNKGQVGSLWARAMGTLSEKDKNTLETRKTGPNLDIEELVEAVRAKRKTCLENQWGFEFRGQSVDLRYQADKIISWLAKFKEVGDIAIQQDPSHAALPWAGIRFLLQVSLQILILALGVNRSTDVYSRTRPDGTSPHGSGKIDEYDQPM